MKRRLFSTFTTLLMVCSLVMYFPQMSILATAASNAEIKSKMIEILYAGNGGSVTCDFDGYTSTSGRHEGIDCCNYKGAKVHSLISGTVIRANNSSSLSTLAIYDSANDATVIYLHSNIQVSEGDSISRGQFVAYEDNRGASAAHTHVELRYGYQKYASVSVGDPTLDNPNPYSYWSKVLFGSIPDFPGSEDTSYNVPVTVYATHDINEIYSNDGGYLESNRYISNGDKCYVDHVYTSGLCHVKYPSGGTEPNRWAYCKASELPLPRGCTCSESYAGTYEVTTSQYPLNIRNGHGSNYDKIGEMPKGAHCTVSKADGTWAHVEYNGVSGFASMEYLTKVSDPTPPVPQGSAMSSGAGQTIPDGDYIIVSELGINLYLDIPGIDCPAKPATYIEICDGNGGIPGKDKMYDTWTVKYLNNGFYKISQYSTNICLDVENASLNMGTNVQTCSDNGSAAQQWSIADSGHGYTLQSRCNGYYLDVYNGKAESGNKVWMYEGNGTNAQSWCFIPVASDNRSIADGEYYIKSAVGDVYLDADGDYNYHNETNIQIWNSKTDSFNVKYVGDGYYKIYETTSGLALDVYNPGDNSFGRGVNVQLYDGSSMTNRAQLWKIQDEGGGNYRLISKLSGYSLDVNGGVAEYGTNVQQYTYNTSNAQKWSFEKVHKHTATATSAKAATCTANGNTAYWYCSGCKKYFSDSACTKEITLASTVINATGHKWGTATYTWSADNKTCTATRVCANNSSHNETEKVNATYSVTKEPTCTDKGTGTYTATFKNTAFAKQTKNVDIATKDHNWNAATYTWSSDYKTCTATRICANNSSHKETETVNTTYSVTKQPTCTDKGKGTYTATFKNTAFTKQTKNVDVAAKGHNWNAATYTWSADNNDNKICTATRVCANDSTHKESETVNSTYSVTKEPTYTDKGLGTYTATFENNAFAKQTKNVELQPIPISTPKVPELTATANEEKVTLKWKPITNAEKYGIAGYANGKWKLLDECYTISYELKNLTPGSKYKVAVVAMYNGKWNLDFSNAVEVTLPDPIPKITYEKGSGSVKLTWTSVRNAERYGIFEYEDDYWNKIGQTTDTYFVMNGLVRGSEHKIAVVTYSDGKWNADFSNAIIVSPNPNPIPPYPKVTDTEYSEKYHQFRLTWNAVDGATEYGIAVKLGGKWKIQAYTDKTYYTSPKLKEGSTAEMVICAKVNGEWDLSSINSRAFKVTVK